MNADVATRDVETICCIPELYRGVTTNPLHCKLCGVESSHDYSDEKQKNQCDIDDSHFTSCEMGIEDDVLASSRPSGFMDFCATSYDSQVLGRSLTRCRSSRNNAEPFSGVLLGHLILLS